MSHVQLESDEEHQITMYGLMLSNKEALAALQPPDGVYQLPGKLVVRFEHSYLLHSCRIDPNLQEKIEIYVLNVLLSPHIAGYTNAATALVMVSICLFDSITLIKMSTRASWRPMDRGSGCQNISRRIFLCTRLSTAAFARAPRRNGQI